jgi:CHASE1-domain containing sensor protein
MNEPLSSETSNGLTLRQDCMPVVWVVLIGIGFSLTVFFVLRSWEQKNVEKAFRLAAEDRATAVKGAFDTELAMLELVRSALISDNRIEQQEFRDILDPFLARSSGIKSVEWVPRVPGSERAELEAAARRDGIDGFGITELTKDGQVVAATKRDEYFPIYYIGPEAGNKTVYGLDLGSETTRFEPLKLARDTGKTTASGRFTLVEETPSENAEDSEDRKDGFLVCLPTYHKNKPVDTFADRRKNLAGFVIGVFRPGEMIESALAKLQPEGIDVGLFDPSDPAGNRTFHYHKSRTGDDRGQPADPQQLLDPKGVRYLVQLDVLGHPWTIVCVPTPHFLAAHESWWPSGVLAVGLAFTAMLAGYLLSSINHRLHLEERVREQTADIRSAQEDVLCRLASASQLRDQETEMHIRRTGLMSQAVARAADWFGEELDAIRQAAPMHDIGKIGIPDVILGKPGELTREEFEVLKNHTRIGADILGGTKVPMLQMARDIALNHHERWDGKGYPRGLAGKNIPESARIVAIVDAYDTLTHGDGIRPALPEDEALAQMRQEAEQQFDPSLLATFFRHLPEIRRIAEAYRDRKRNGTRDAGPTAANVAAVSFGPPSAGPVPEGAGQTHGV